MNNTGKRLLTFFIGLPVVLLLVIVPHFNHGPLNILILFFTVVGAIEFHNMASLKTKLYPKVFFVILSALFPVISYLLVYFNLSFEYILWFFAACVLVFMAIESFTGTDFSSSFEKIALSSLGIFYTGFLISFLTRISGIGVNSSIILKDGTETATSSTPWIVIFLVFVFMCDSAAWFFGILFGKGTRGFFKASPNKSLVGFIGGIFADVALAVLIKLIVNYIFKAEIYPGPYWKIIVLAFITAIAGIVGDLIESVLKRSCGIKDSGNLIPGRGGSLDSIDSILMAAPVFYITVHFLYGL